VIPLGTPSPAGALRADDAARLAVGNSRELKNAAWSRLIKEGTWKLGLRAYLPRLSLGAQENDRVSWTGADSFMKSYSLTLEQLIWDGGRTSLSREMERAELLVLDKQIRRQAVETADAAVSAYRRTVSLRATLEIREAICSFFEEQRNILSRELELGMAVPIDLTAADIALAGARLEVMNLRVDLEDAERSLGEFLGMETLPPLSERVDMRRTPVLPPPGMAGELARERNPQVEENRFVITQREAEMKLAGRSWIPAIQLKAGAGLSGQKYPLTKPSWSVGITFEFSAPWLSGSFGGTAAWEPPHDRSAGLQGSLNPLPNPAGAYTKKQAELALRAAKETYTDTRQQLGRKAEFAVEKCRLMDRKRLIVLESLELEEKKFNLAELKLEMGLLTRTELMDARLELAKKEIAGVESAAALLEAERELEKLQDLEPGGLGELGGGNRE